MEQRNVIEIIAPANNIILNHLINWHVGDSYSFAQLPKIFDSYKTLKISGPCFVETNEENALIFLIDHIQVIFNIGYLRLVRYILF